MLTGFPSPSFLSPDMEVETVANIDAGALYQRGIRGVGFDADQTLCRFYGKEIDADLAENVERIRETFDGNVCIISNCTAQRHAELVENFPLHVVPVHSKKPSSDPFRAAEKHFQLPPSEWAFVGDRLLTDIVGANRAGWFSVLVNPLIPDTDPWYMRPARRYEHILRKVYRV